jgi:aspartate-semialdehyde dehydrogenase
MERIRVGILGATGTVGQRFIQLLADHPWFEITAVAASERSAGQCYGDVCHWLLPTPMPERVATLKVEPVEPGLDCRLVFSSLPSNVAAEVEARFAQAGYAVCSNASAHRMDPDVPLLIPEVNADHVALLEVQQAQRGWKGWIATSANCSSTQLALALKPLHDAFGVRALHVTTLQAVSGAGYPGVASLDIVGNVVPYIRGEEEKMESEPLKMLGTLRKGKVGEAPVGEAPVGEAPVGEASVDEASIVEAPITISAQCNRVPVRDGHTECVSVCFERVPTQAELAEALAAFRGPLKVAKLPSTPQQPILVRDEPDRPQPILDRDAGGGYAVSVERIRPCPLLDYRFVVLGHNTLRGAAGGAIHNAELLAAEGWLD